MAYEKKNGDISIFKNEKKTAENNYPDYNRQALIEGVLYNVSFWLKYPDGKPAFLSGKIEKHVPKTKVEGDDPIQAPPVLPPATESTDSPDDLPF